MSSDAEAGRLLYADTTAKPAHTPAASHARPASGDDAPMSDARAGALLYPDMAPPAAKPPPPAAPSPSRERSPAEVMYDTKPPFRPSKDAERPLSETEIKAKTLWPDMDRNGIKPEADEAESADGAEAGATVELFEGYEIQLPEGVELLPNAHEIIGPLVEKHDIGPEAATDLIAFHVDALNEAVESTHQANLDGFAQLRRSWRAAAATDEEIKQLGGLERAVTDAKSALKSVDPEFRKLLDEFGMLDHPATVRTFARLQRQRAANGDLYNARFGKSKRWG